MATFTGLETVNSVTNYKILTTTNQGYVSYIHGVGYATNNPFYTCPANTYAKVIIKFYNSSGTLAIGDAAFGSFGNDGIIGNYWGTMIDFGVFGAGAGDYTTHYAGNEAANGSGMNMQPTFYLMPGEKLMRNSNSGSLGTGIVFQVIEYAIP